MALYPVLLCCIVIDRLCVWGNDSVATVSIQEKTLSTCIGDGWVRKAPRTAHSIDVTGDRNKVEGSGIFVHITTVSDTHTDTAAVSAKREGGELGYTVVITNNDRLTAFGRYAGTLQLYYLSPSYVNTI